MKLQESMTGFYYVGTKRAIITKLVNIYKRGYASGKLNESMTELLNKDHILPQVIICDGSYGFAAIKQWFDLLVKNERLHGVPANCSFHYMKQKISQPMNWQEDLWHQPA
jgi:hypothetical protein